MRNSELVSNLPQMQMSAPLAVDDVWRSLTYFGLYRLLLAALLLTMATLFGAVLSQNENEQAWFFWLGVAYLLLTLVSLALMKVRRLSFSLQLALQVGTDIVAIASMSYFSGGIQSNLGMLLLVSLAAAGLITRGRITLFYAALASIALLLEHAYSVLTQDAAVGLFFQAGILSSAYFGVAWLSHTLSKYAIASEKLAFVRGVDLDNMAEANRLMIQDMQDGVLVVDERGTLRQSNPSAERLLGHTLGAQSSLTLSECSPLLDAMFAAWRQNKSLGQDALLLPTTHRWVNVRFLPVQRETFWGAVIVLEDMQRVQAQAQQVKLAALGRLTANIAHEVRNPLSSISYAAELLQEGEKDPAQTRLTQIILDNAGRLNRIVQDVMQLNRRDRAKQQIIDLKEYLFNLREEICQTETLASALIEIDVPAGCKVSFDRDHLNQVLLNLCQNALRYCQRQTGSVQLCVTQTVAHRVQLTVADDGTGIDADTAHQIFEPFFTTEARGTGLGLYIARELCEANGASLEYLPKMPLGACFKITFGVQHEHG
jgi:two-component system sensor histidine kinase PilS (NtrC family)